MTHSEQRRKMHFSRTLVCVYVFYTCLLVGTCVSDGENGFTRDNMKKMVKSMLGFKEIPNSRKGFRGKTEAPQYMLDLYNRFKDRPVSVGQRSSNTVRSIQAKIDRYGGGDPQFSEGSPGAFGTEGSSLSFGAKPHAGVTLDIFHYEASTDTVNGKPMFVFDLSPLTSTKQMISAEIHLYKRKKSRFNKNADLELNLYEIAPHYTIERNSIKLNIASYGWQWYDVTDVVTSCAAQRRVSPHSLGISFEITKSSGTTSVFDLKRFTQHHSTPYLIIYSNDTDDLDIEELEKDSENEKDKSDDVNSESSDVIIPQSKKRNKRSVSDNSADLPIYSSRSRSISILTNEIPEVPDEFRPYPIGINLKTHPGMLQTRKETRHRLTDTRLIPYPGDSGNRRRRKKLRERRRKKNKKGRKNKDKLDLPKKWDDLERMAEEEGSRGLCGRKKLILDFNDIGWGDWVISPKSFKAHYCAGRCPFPLTKKLRPTNHATIQSLVNTVNPNVPAPCCSPEKLSSITLLYFDENGNVVLKNYPNMTVRKCGCR